MGVELSVAGGESFARAAAAFREAGNKGMLRQLTKAADRAADHIEREVRDSTDRYMPRGYERTFAQALRVRRQKRTQGHGARVTLMFAGAGRGEPRDVRRMEEGELRHPVFGRRRRLKNPGGYKQSGRHADRVSGGQYRNPWVAQRIRPGFVSEPGNRAAPKARQEFVEAIHALEKQIREGM